MQKFIVVSANWDYWVCTFNENFWNSTLTELKSLWTMSEDIITLIVKGEDEDDEFEQEIYVKILDIPVNSDTIDLMNAYSENDIVDYDQSKHNDILIIEE